MKILETWFPPAVIIAGALYLATALIPVWDKTDEMQIHNFGRLPAIEDGRVKPLDTVARNAMMLISHRQTYTQDEVKQPAIRWLLDAMSTSMRSKKDDSPAFKAEVFRIDNDQLLGLLDLKERSGLRYSFSEFRDKIPNVMQQVETARNKKPEDRDAYDSSLLSFARSVNALLTFVRLEGPFVVPAQEADGEWSSVTDVLRNSDSKPREIADAKQMSAILHAYAAGDVAEFNRAVTDYRLDLKARDPQGPSSADASLMTIDSLAKFFVLCLAIMAPLLINWGLNLGPLWRGALSLIQLGLVVFAAATIVLPTIPKIDLELLFNQGEPFYKCTLLYVTAFLLVVAGWIFIALRSLLDDTYWLGWSRLMLRSAFWLIALVLVVHTAALGARMYIQGRPPVTNLYSSAVFIGWGAVIFGMVLERLYRNGLGVAIASVVGFASLLIAHFLATMGETMEPMQAVLDSNFWLSTHVVCVTIGYTATFVAGFLGVLYVILGLFTPVLDRKTSKELSSMIYGVVCFATLFSFVGTVLGGIWADQSWGRFWGWDPKENGALLIVLSNSLFLHARWAGLARPRGQALLAVSGNIVTSWSWFGVNMLGVGLHTYGFTQATAFWFAAFVGSQLAIIGLGLAVPIQHWQSFVAQARNRPPVPRGGLDDVPEASLA